MMINKMNSKIKGLASILVAVMMVLALATPVFAKEYKISFKAGSKGTYQDGTTSQNVKVEANGALGIDPDTLVGSLTVEDGYYFNGWNYTIKQTGITKSANYVAQYKRIVDEAVYRVNYVDTYGNQLATQKVVTSNVGIVVAENAVNIEGYAVDFLTKTAKVEKKGTEITFVYVSTASGEVETIIQNDVVVVAGGGTAGTGAGTGTGTGTGTGGGAGTGTGTGEGTTGNEAGGTGGLGTEEVPEDETPLAGNDGKTDSETDSNSNLYLIGGGLLAVVVIAGAIYFVKRKKA